MEDNKAQKKISVFNRTTPALLAIAPVSMLFGAVSSQADWTILEVLLISILGFTGSGQFALLPLVESGAGILTLFIVAASINSRYFPIALSASSRLPKNKILKIFTAHTLGDEAYATESEKDDEWTVMTIRWTIFFTWIVSSVIGYYLANFLPESLLKKELHIAFPASIVLLYLAATQLVQLKNTCIYITSRVIILSILISFLMINFFGTIFFWVPSIIIITMVLYIQGKA